MSNGEVLNSAVFLQRNYCREDFRGKAKFDLFIYRRCISLLEYYAHTQKALRSLKIDFGLGGDGSGLSAWADPICVVGLYRYLRMLSNLYMLGYQFIYSHSQINR